MDGKERDGARFEGPKFCGRPSAAAAVEGPEIWTFAL